MDVNFPKYQGALTYGVANFSTSMLVSSP